MRVPLKDGGAELVTVWNDDGARIEAADGADAPLPAVATVSCRPRLTRARYGVGPIDGWSAGELASLERALALLSPQELAAIWGCRFAACPPPPAICRARPRASARRASNAARSA